MRLDVCHCQIQELQTIVNINVDAHLWTKSQMAAKLHMVFSQITPEVRS